MSDQDKVIVTYREIIRGLQQLGLDNGSPVIAHASLSSFGEVRGGGEALLGALDAVAKSLIMPTFTFTPNIIPEIGPVDNGIEYGSGQSLNLMAEFFRPDLPADKAMGIVPEILRKSPGASRSSHPLLSFSGLHVEHALETQTLADPLAPIRVITEQGGWVLLLGVNHTRNTSIHYAEKLAGRKQFIRWALTPEGIVECPGFPGCSDGFQAIMPRLEVVSRRVTIGKALVQAIPIKDLITAVVTLISEDPLSLLCNRPTCERCNAIRKAHNDGDIHPA